MSSAELTNPPAIKLAFLRDVDGVRLPLGEAVSHSAAVPGVGDAVVFSPPDGARLYGYRIGKRTFHYDEDGNLAQVDLFVTVG